MRAIADDGAMVAAGMMPGDDRLFVQFYMRPVQNEAKSLEAGRPIYEDTPCVRIAVPGDKDNVIDRPVWDDPLHPQSDTARFAKQYQAWKAGNNQEIVTGTPLETLTTLVPPILSMAQVEELKHFKVRTAEQLEGMPDAIAQRFMGINEIRRKVKTFLEASKSNAPLEHLRSELNERDEQIAALRQALKEQGDQIAKLEKQKRQ